MMVLAGPSRRPTSRAAAWKLQRLCAKMRGAPAGSDLEPNRLGRSVPRCEKPTTYTTGTGLDRTTESRTDRRDSRLALQARVDADAQGRPSASRTQSFRSLWLVTKNEFLAYHLIFDSGQI